MPEIVILGAGLAGLSAAYHLKGNYEIYEKNGEAGGLCRSRHIDGFTFDYGPHILFPKYEDISALIQNLLAENLNIQAREAWIYHKYCNRYTRFPFQAHLYGLPVAVVKECLLGLFYAQEQAKNTRRRPKNYEEWIYWNFGEGIAKHLMIPYAKKLWTVEPSEMNFDWVRYRVPRPKLEDVLEGALSDNPQRFGFNTEFWYPVRGGIQALPEAFLDKVKPVHFKKRATRIYAKEKRIEFNGGEKVSYERLISTLPLPEVIKLLDPVPPDVKKAAEDLEHNSVLCVNLGIDREKISDKHWVYFYEDEFSLHRISFQKNFSPHTTPKNQDSISTEMAYSRYRPMNKQNAVERAREDLIKCRLLSKEDRIAVAEVLDIKYAYIIYDHRHRRNVGKIHRFLRSYDIYPCGRFGEWEYFNMDDTLQSGQRVAEELNQTKNKARAAR